MRAQDLDDLTQLTAVGRSDDGLVRAKIGADGCPIGFKLAADHPSLNPEETLTLALQALRNAHAELRERADEIVESHAADGDPRRAGHAEREIVAENERTIDELGRYAAGMRCDLEATMNRLGKLLDHSRPRP